MGLSFFVQAQEITQTHFDSIWNLSHPTAVLLEKIDSLAMSIDPFGNDLPLKQIQRALALSKNHHCLPEVCNSKKLITLLLKR